MAGFRRLISLLLAAFVALGMTFSPLYAEVLGSSSSISVPNGDQQVSVSAGNENIRNVLRDVAMQGGLNLIMDESVTGNITIDLNNVTLNQALQSIASMGNLTIIRRSGNIYLAIEKQAAENKGINRQLSKVIKIYYSNANRIAGVLNRSLLATSSSGGTQQQGQQKVQADSRSNSLIVVGTEQEIKLVEEAVARLDLPRQSKTFYLSHANALDLASMLASSVFNDGTASLVMGGSGGGGASGGGSAAGGTMGNTNTVTPSSVRVERQDIEDSDEIYEFGGGDSTGVTSGVTLRAYVKTSDMVQVSPQGVLIIPDTRTNAITIMGTAEQIGLAERVIPVMDAQLPQVAIEASLVEITDAGVKELSSQWGIADGKLQIGFNNSAGTDGINNADELIGLPTTDPSVASTVGASGIGFSTNPVNVRPDLLAQINAMVRTDRARILANPTVVATHDTESIISIVDEVVRRIIVSIDENGFATTQPEFGEVGIVLDILPKIGEDNTITMRLRPSVTSIRELTEDDAGNTVTLLRKRDLLTQAVRVQDGQTLVIGGLIQEEANLSSTKLPGLGDLPLLGAMFRSSTNRPRRSELIMLITPHIMSNTKLTPVSYTEPIPVGGNH